MQQCIPKFFSVNQPLKSSIGSLVVKFLPSKQKSRVRFPANPSIYLFFEISKSAQHDTGTPPSFCTVFAIPVPASHPISHQSGTRIKSNTTVKSKCHHVCLFALSPFNFKRFHHSHGRNSTGFFPMQLSRIATLMLCSVGKPAKSILTLMLPFNLRSSIPPKVTLPKLLQLH